MTVLGSIGATEHLVAAAAAVGLAVLAVLIARRFVGTGRQFAQPAVVFAAVWGVSLGLFAIPWVRYIGSPVKTYVAVYGSITLFLAGAAAAYRLVPSPAPPADSDETLVPGRIRILWVICLVLGLIGFAFYVRAVNAVVGWHAFFDNLGLVRGIQTTSARFDDLYGPWRLLTYVDLVAVLVWTIGLRSKAFSGRWRFVAPLGVLSILPFAFTGERTLLTTLVVWGVLFHITWRPTGIRRLLTVGVAILAVLVVAFSVIGGRVNKTLATHPEIAAVLENDAPHKIALQYVYITANIPTLTRLMEDPIAPHTHGAMTALPLVKVVHAGGVGGVPPEEVGAFYPIPFETFNNLSWLGTFYLDFGLAGCLILPLLLGFAATAATQIAFRRRTVLRTWLASLVLYVVAFSPLLNKLSTTLTWEYAALGPVVVPFMRVDGYARIRQRPAWLRAGRWQAGALAAMVVAGIAFLIVVPVDNPEASADRASLTARLTRAAARVQDVALHGGLPLAQPLASQLHVADPAVRYQSASTFTTLPDVPGTITVYRGGDEVWLWGRAADNSVLGMDINVAARTATLTQPPSASANLLVNGDLEPPIVRPWQISESRNAAIRSDVTASSASNASLLLVGKRHRSKHGGAFVTQIVRKLPERSPGTRFTFRIQVLSADLSRELPIAMALRYTDGTSQFATATRGTSGRPQPGVSAVPPNTNGTWQTVTATTVAKKHVRAVQVFLFDTGTQPLSGAAGFDAASLVVGPRLAAFPPPR